MRYHYISWVRKGQVKRKEDTSYKAFKHSTRAYRFLILVFTKIDFLKQWYETTFKKEPLHSKIIHIPICLQKLDCG